MISPERIIAFTELLGQSQYWPPEKMRAYQEEQLARLLRHAYETVPFYRDRLAPLFRRRWGPRLHKFHEIPILTRAEIIENYEALISTNIPEDHKPIYGGMSSGSTGKPVRFLTTGLSMMARHTVGYRSFDWHNFDREKPHASISVSGGKYPEGLEFPSWSPAAEAFGEFGPSYMLSSHTSIDNQITWLQRVAPDYLYTYPSNLEALARRISEEGIMFSSLKGLSTGGELLEMAQRKVISAAFGLTPFDRYGARETAPIAYEAIAEDGLALNEEVQFTEIVTAQGAPVQPGGTGRVILTPLYNLAFVLIRYDIGDFAIADQPRPDGIRLSRLKAVLGRQRNMFTYPDRTTHWPAVDLVKLNEIMHLRQRQFIQHQPGVIEMKYVADKPIGDRLLKDVVDYLKSAFHPDCEFVFNQVGDIARHPSGKFEEYLSLVAPHPRR